MLLFVVPLIAVTVIAVVVFFGWFWLARTETTDVTLTHAMQLAVEGRVQEIRVEEADQISAVKFIVSLDDGSELVGRAVSSAELRRVFEQAGIANLDDLIKLR